MSKFAIFKEVYKCQTDLPIVTQGGGQFMPIRGVMSQKCNLQEMDVMMIGQQCVLNTIEGYA